ncbi:tetratricopeptide repeat protein [Lacibacterium aquatile]|uniref:Tetratricopeptide repeat protein n=1 Tax=Lacibacterium aquatile TaxID=1168082 RepID=A0ABW5DZ21_9PROT
MEEALSAHFTAIQPAFDFELAIVGGQYSACPPLTPEDLLPDYHFRRKHFPSPSAAAYLMTLAEGAEASHRPDIALALAHGAIAFDGKHIDALLLLARHAHRGGQIEQAIQWARQAALSDPASTKAHVLLGRLHLESGQFEETNTVLGPFLDRYPDAEGFWYRGNALLQMGHAAQAAAHFKVVIDQTPAFPEARIALGEALARLGRINDAIATTREALRLANHPHWVIRLAGLLVRADKGAEALAILEPMFLQQPDNQAIRCLLAEIHMQQGNMDLARHLLETGLQMAPDALALWLGRGALERHSGHLARAAAIATEITERWPEQAEGWHLRGLVFRDQKNIEAARQNFIRALQLAPRSIPVTLAMAELALAKGWREEALGYLDSLLHAAPGILEARRLKADILVQEGRFPEASALLIPLCRHGEMRRAPGFWLPLATLLEGMGRTRAASLALRRILRIAPKDPEALARAIGLARMVGDEVEVAHLGGIFLDLHPDRPLADAITSAQLLADGHTAAAAVRAEAAVYKAPKEAEGWFQLGRVRHRQGRLSEAEEALAQARALAIGRADILLEIAEVLKADQRFAEAKIALKLASELAPRSVPVWLALSGAYEKAGAFAQALDAITHAKALAPNDVTVHLTLTRLRLILDPQATTEDILALLDRPNRLEIYRSVLAAVTAAGNFEALPQLAAKARATFPEDDAIGLAYLHSRRTLGSTGDQARTTRHWARRLMQKTGQAPLVPQQPRIHGNRLRIAYLLAGPDVAAIETVVRNHDTERVEIHIYMDASVRLAGDVRHRVNLHPLSGGNLRQSLIANGIEVSVDMGGFAPWAGQIDILKAFAARTAPLQCLWPAEPGDDAGLHDLTFSSSCDTLAEDVERAGFATRDTDRQWWQNPDAKERSRAIAHRSFANWQGREQRLTLSSSEQPDITLVLVLFNQAGLTLECLRSIADQQGVGFETILIDNASSDETAYLLDRVDGALIVRNSTNHGFLEAANQGAALARGRHIVFLNTDALLQENALAHALRRIDSDPAIGVVGGRVVLADGTLQEAGCMALSDGWTAGYGRGQSPDLPEFRFVREVECVSGAFLMVRRTLWQALGGFDPVYGPAYYEDTDLCLRAGRGGFKTIYDPTILVTHLEWGSAVDLSYSRTQMIRNRPIFAARHGDAIASRPDIFAYDPLHQRSAAKPCPNLLMLDDVIPCPGEQPLEIIRTLSSGYNITLLPMCQTEADWSEVYADLPDTTEVMLGRGTAGLEDFLEQRQGFYRHLLVRQAHNIEFVANLRRRSPHIFASCRIVGELSTSQTLAPDFLSQIDCLLVASGRERETLHNLKATDVRLLKPIRSIPEAIPDFEAREGLLLVTDSIMPGSVDEDGVLWLMESLLPRLEALLGQSLSVTLVADCRSDRVTASADGTLQVLNGDTDLDPLMDRARLLVVPTRALGGGSPLAIDRAMTRGLPIVASHLAVRRQEWDLNIELLARDVDTIIPALADLYRSPTHWRLFQQAGLKRSRQVSSPDAFACSLTAALQGSE